MEKKNKPVTLDKKLIKKRIAFTIILSIFTICCIVGMILTFIYCKK